MGVFVFVIVSLLCFSCGCSSVDGRHLKATHESIHSLIFGGEVFSSSKPLKTSGMLLDCSFENGTAIIDKLRSINSKSDITSIKLSFCEFTSSEMERVGNIIQQFNNLEELSLTDATFRGSSFEGESDKRKHKILLPLAHSLRRIPQLKHLSLAGCKLNDEQIETLGYLFRPSRKISPKMASNQSSPFLESLDLSRNCLTASSMTTITKRWSPSFRGLQGLDLSFNLLGERGLHILAANMEEFPLRYAALTMLHLRQVGAHIGSITHLLDALNGNTSGKGCDDCERRTIADGIEILDVSGNFLLTSREENAVKRRNKSQGEALLETGRSLLKQGHQQVCSVIDHVQVAANTYGELEFSLSTANRRRGPSFRPKLTNLKRLGSRQISSGVEKASSVSHRGRKVRILRQKLVSRSGLTRNRGTSSQLSSTETRFIASLSQFLRKATRLHAVSLMKTQLNDRFVDTAVKHELVEESDADIEHDQVSRVVLLDLNPLSPSKKSKLLHGIHRYPDQNVETYSKPVE